MNTRNLKWLRIRNRAALAALVPIAIVFCAIVSPLTGIFVAVRIVDENMKGGLK